MVSLEEELNEHVLFVEERLEKKDFHFCVYFVGDFIRVCIGISQDACVDKAYRKDNTDDNLSVLEERIINYLTNEKEYVLEKPDFFKINPERINKEK